MKFKNLLLILLCTAPFAFGQLFTRVGQLPLPSGQSGFGNMIAGVDLDGDGKMEVYLPNDNWSDGATLPAELIPVIYKYEYDGALGWNLVWQATLAPGLVTQNTWPALAVGDLDKDGKKEIIWGPVNFSPYTSNHTRVVVYEVVGDGSDNLGVADGPNWKPNAKWSIDTTAGLNIRPFKWVVADPDGDGTNELVFSLRNGTNIFNVASVSNIPDNGDGSETWTLEYAGGGAPTYNDLVVLNNYAYVFPAASAGNCIGFKYDAGAWTALPVQAGLVPGGSWNSASVVDINGDLTNEVVLAANGSSDRHIYLLQQAGDSLIATQIADMAPMLGAGRLYGGSAGDIDLNGKLDFAFGSRDATPNDAVITRLEYMGGDITLPASYVATVIDQGYVPPTFGFGRYMHVAIANVDGDPRAEVLYGEGTGEQAPVIILDSEGQIPVELKSFAASVVDGFVHLNWATATETNNRGFEVQRAAGGEFVTIGFVEGNGTTTEARSYSFVDNSVQSGAYSYRLKQVDLDGSYAYSNVVEVTLNPTEFNLAQNYPNPFNPSTTINFSLAKESNVSLKVFDLLGQQIMSLVNNEFMQAGSYSYKFDASSLSSGTYIYRLEAGDFVQTKKMTLSK